MDLKSPNDRVLSHAIVILSPFLCRNSWGNKRSQRAFNEVLRSRVRAAGAVLGLGSCWTAAALRRAVGTVAYRSVAAAPRSRRLLVPGFFGFSGAVEDLVAQRGDSGRSLA